MAGYLRTPHQSSRIALLDKLHFATTPEQAAEIRAELDRLYPDAAHHDEVPC